MWKKMILNLLSFLNVTSRPNPLFVSNLKNIRYYFKSRKRDPDLAKGDVACIMCTFREEYMVPFALESSKDFVSKYIIVDKDGGTVPTIKECRDNWDLDIEIYVKPDLTLRESRAFAATKIDEPWILVQDGDEVFHTDGPNAIFSLRRYMDRPNIVLCTPIIFLMGDFLHTRSINPQMPPHPFLYHNNGTIRAPDPPKDLLVIDGWKIRLPSVYKFNCRVGPPRSLFLRFKTRGLHRDTGTYLKYKNREDYITKELGIDIDSQLYEWHAKFLSECIPYDENKWGYYPKIIRHHLGRE